MIILQFAGIVFLLIGVAFSVLGVVGVWRFPELYAKLHASGKAGTLGILSLCLGAGLMMPELAPKLFALGLFVFFSNPVASHAIAAAEHRLVKGNPQHDPAKRKKE